jgi:biopolymer transport protein ExbB
VKKRKIDALRASTRSASLVHREMKRGLNSLASIAATAPLVGFFGTVMGMFRSFSGGSTERGTLMRGFAKSLSESLVPTALGLSVAVLAFCFYKYLSARLENFDVEMQNASLELIDELAHL